MNYDPVQKRAEILCLLSEGKSLRSACLETGVHLQTAMGWLRRDEEWRKAYLDAKQEGADALAEKITDLAQEALDAPEKANAIRVAMDAYKWVASKLKPKSYGDRIEQHVIDETPKSPEDVSARIRLLEAELSDLMRQSAGHEDRSEEQSEEQSEGSVPSLSTHSTTRLPSPTIQ